MRLVIEIDLSNDGLEYTTSISNILDKVSAELLNSMNQVQIGDGFGIRDINGNTIGQLKIKRSRHSRYKK